MAASPLISVIVPTYFRDPHDPRLKVMLSRFFGQFSKQREDRFDIWLCNSGPAPHREPIEQVIEQSLKEHQWLKDKVHHHYVAQETPQSRAEAMNEGVTKSTGEYLLFLHIDCLLPAGGLAQVRRAFATGALGGGFLKKYVGKEALSPLMLTERYLNWLRTWISRHLVGTNGIFLHRQLAEEHPYQGDFLEDVELSDWMRIRLEGSQWQLILAPIEVSARKYQKRGVWPSIAINFSVMAFYRIFARDPIRLKEQLYHRSFPEGWRFWKVWLEAVFGLLRQTDDAPSQPPHPQRS